MLWGYTYNGFTQAEPTSQLTDDPANSSSYSQGIEHELHRGAGVGGADIVIPKLGALPTVRGGGCFQVLHLFVFPLAG